MLMEKVYMGLILTILDINDFQNGNDDDKYGERAFSSLRPKEEARVYSSLGPKEEARVHCSLGLKEEALEYSSLGPKEEALLKYLGISIKVRYLYQEFLRTKLQTI